MSCEAEEKEENQQSNASADRAAGNLSFGPVAVIAEETRHRRRCVVHVFGGTFWVSVAYFFRARRSASLHLINRKVLTEMLWQVRWNILVFTRSPRRRPERLA